jgi:hypothetical protein
MEIAMWHTGRLMLTNHYHSMWTPRPCRCLHHTWAESYPAQPFMCYYYHHHYHFWHTLSVPSTKCPFLRVTEQHWMVSSQDFLGAMEWGHHSLFNLESRELVCDTAKRKSLQWHKKIRALHSATKLDTFTVTFCNILFCFGYNMHVFTRAHSYFLNKLHDHWVYTENSYYSDLKQTQYEIQQWN